MTKTLHPKKDKDAWDSYPHLRAYFNKLDLSLRLGYLAGPAGTSVPKSGTYVVRPIYNLAGLSVNTKFVELNEGDTILDASQFWCEEFNGDHLSIDFTTHKSEMYPQRCWQGHKSKKAVHYDKWTRVEKNKIPENLHIPDFLSKDLSQIFQFNIEFIGSKIIEIHLHHNTWFPSEANEIIPIWDDGNKAMDQHIAWNSAGYSWIESEYDAHGQTEAKRLGFYWKR
jgi:hypothetical protein